MKRISIYQLTIHATVILLLSGMALHASAETEEQEVARQENVEPQSPAKAWLELQRSGRAASLQAQPISGPVMDRTHERYLESFTHPVPPYFDHVQPINY